MRPSVCVVVCLSILNSHFAVAQAPVGRPEAWSRPDPHVRAGEGTGEGCSASQEGIANGMRRTLDEIDNEERRDTRRLPPVTTGIPGREVIDNCYALLRSFITQCSNPTVTRSPDCVRSRGGAAPESARPGEDTGIGGAQDRMITTLVAQANCQRNIGSCFKYGAGLKGFPSREEVEEKCGSGLDRKIQALGTSNEDNHRRVRMMAARALYNRMDERYFTVQAACADRRGEESERDARQLLEHRLKALAEADHSLFSISCLERQRSSKNCQYVANGEAKLQEMADIGSDPSGLKGDAPVRIHGTCSATCLSGGGGCSEVITAGHGCASAGADMTVYDRDGRGHTVKATSCRTNFDGDLRGDYAICQLDRSVDTNPVLLATYDPSVQGDKCQQMGHLLRCGVGFYQRLADNRVEVNATIFPAGGRMSYVRGHLYYDATTNMLYHDLMTGRGASGAGLLVNVDGRLVVIGAHSWSQQQQLLGGAARPDWEVIKAGLVVSSVDPSKLRDSTSFWNDVGEDARSMAEAPSALTDRMVAANQM